MHNFSKFFITLALITFAGVSLMGLNLGMNFEENGGTYNEWVEHDITWTWDGTGDTYFGNPAPRLTASILEDTESTLAPGGTVITIESIEFQGNSPATFTISGFNGNTEVYSQEMNIDGTGVYDYVPYTFNWENLTSIKIYHAEMAQINIDNIVFEIYESATGEDFEIGHFEANPWYFTGDGGWHIAEDNVYGGMYSARSDSISDSQVSTMNIDLNITEAADVSFYHLESTEVDWDGLRFIVDYTDTVFFSDSNSWEQYTYAVTPGLHTFTWQYFKDMAVSERMDCAWVDDISFPAFEEYGSVSATVQDVNNAAVQGAVFSIYDGAISRITGSGGGIAIPALTPGDYDFTIVKEGFIDYEGTMTITSASNTELTITMNSIQTVSITGIVQTEYNSPLTPEMGGTAKLIGNVNYEVATGADGSFEIEDVESGEYEVNVFGTDYRAWISNIEVVDQSIDLGTITLDELIWPVSGLTAELNDNDEALIDWTGAGVEMPDEFRHDDGNYFNVMSFSVDQFPNHMFGSAFYYSGIIEDLRWWLSDGNSGGHTEAQLLIFGLTEDGTPNSNDIIYDTGWIPNTDNEWNIYELPEPIHRDEGFFVGVRVHDGFGTYIVFDDGIGIPWEAQVGNSWSNNDASNPSGWNHFTLDGNNHNVMIRAGGLIIDELEYNPQPTPRSITETGAFAGDPIFNVVHSGNNSGSRDFTGYTVYRMLKGDEFDETEWTEIATGVMESEYTDTDISNQPDGVYKYAVKCNYTNGEVSRAKISNRMPWNMIAYVEITLEIPSEGDVDGAVIRLIGADSLAEHRYEAWYTDGENTVEFPVWKQQYTLYAYHTGYDDYLQENIYIYSDYTQTVDLTEILNPANAVGATINEQSIDIVWQTASQELLWDQYNPGNETSTVTLQDFLEEGWDPFDREGAFDVVFDEAVKVEYFNFRTIIYETLNELPFEANYYYEAVEFEIQIHQDFNGAPREAYTDSLNTLPAYPNDFWEYKAILPEPLELEPGTYWISVSAWVPIHVNGSPYGTFSRFYTTSLLGNETTMYYRMPGDGYGLGYDVWNLKSFEICTKLVGCFAEDDAARDVLGYNVYRMQDGQQQSPEDWELIGEGLLGYSYTDNGLTQSGDYVYAVVALYSGGQEAEAAFSNVVDFTDVNQPYTISKLATKLSNNYPNPFNPETVISFSLKEEGPVRIDVYNVTGQKVTTLVNGDMDAGQHSIVWNGTDKNGYGVSSGVYFYRMKTDNYTSMKKMVLMK